MAEQDPVLELAALRSKIEVLRRTCHDKNHKGLDLVITGRVQNPEDLGQDAAFVYKRFQGMDSVLIEGMADTIVRQRAIIEEQEKRLRDEAIAYKSLAKSYEELRKQHGQA